MNTTEATTTNPVVTWLVRLTGDGNTILSLAEDNEKWRTDILKSLIVIDDDFPSYISADVKFETIKDVIKFFRTCPDAFLHELRIGICCALETSEVKAWVWIDGNGAGGNTLINKQTQSPDTIRAYELLKGAAGYNG